MHATLSDVLPDALARALGSVVADAKREWTQAHSLFAAEARATISDLRAQNLELRAEIKGFADQQIARIEEKLAAIVVKDGRDGDPGPPGRDGKDFDAQVLEATVVAHVAKAVAELPTAKDGARSEPGSPGRGIADLQISGGYLIIRMTDGEEFYRGPVVGRDGRDGEPGKDADPELIDKLVTERVATAVSALPPAKDGVDGKDGRDGIDGLPGPSGPQGEAGPQGPAGEKGEQGQVGPQGPEGPQGETGLIGPVGVPGADGLDGKDADPELVTAIVAEHVERAIAALPPPRDGIDGRDGQDVDPTVVDALVTGAVAKAVAELPAPKKGEPGPAGADGRGIADLSVDEDGKLSVRLTDDTVLRYGRIVGRDGEKGEPGESIKGDPGPKGEKGDAGRDGTGVAGAFINRDGELIFTLSDGTLRELGLIVGRDGAPGQPGHNGKDGLSFDDFVLEPEYDGERTLRLKWSDAKGKEQSREWRLPTTIYRGVWKETASYETGDMTTWSGSLWHCNAPTKAKPGNGEAAWTLCAKKGADGRDGAPGAKGDPGPPGRPGVDLMRTPLTDKP